MLVLDEQQTRAALPMKPLIESLAGMFQRGCEMPVRHHHTVAVPGDPDATLLLMPAWTSGGYMGVKIAAVFPGNSSRGLPAVNASYALMSAATGQMLAILDGGELTARRTAAASALAADYLSRADARHLLVVGTGRLALNLVEAHAAVRPIRQVTVWGRSLRKAQAVADKAAAAGFDAQAARVLADAVNDADIVSCATLSSEPLVRGEWLKPGSHLDLIGAFTPTMRESDDDAIRIASVYVDTYAGATKEAGDIVQAIRSGALNPAWIRAELAELCRGERLGRQQYNEVTLFKSVGAALEDLAGAILAYETARRK